MNIPSMKIDDYLKHLYKYSEMQTNTLVVSLILVDRFCNKFYLDLTANNV